MDLPMTEQTLTSEQSAVIDEFDELCRRFGLPMDMGYLEMIQFADVEIPAEAQPLLDAWYARYMEAFPGQC